MRYIGVDTWHQLRGRPRAGLHVGEIEVLPDDIAGIAVHLAARIVALAGESEILVSSTVKDLVVGSGLEFEDCGTRLAGATRNGSVTTQRASRPP